MAGLVALAVAMDGGTDESEDPAWAYVRREWARLDFERRELLKRMVAIMRPADIDEVFTRMRPHFERIFYYNDKP